MSDVAGGDRPDAGPTARPPRWLVIVGVALIVAGGSAAIGPTVAARGICALVPCDPATPSVGFRSEKGAVVVEVGPASGRDVQVIEARAPDGTDEAEHGTVLWRLHAIGSTGGAHPGSFVIGAEKPGFRTEVPLTSTVPTGTIVEVSNGCYFGIGRVPSRLPDTKVVTEVGSESIARFNKNDIGFSECESPMSSGSRIVTFVGVSMAIAGFVLSAVTRRTHHPASR